MAGFDAQTMGRSIKRLVLTGVVLVVLLWVGCSATKRVEAGFVGVSVKLAGASGGVQDDQLDPGWHLYNPVTYQILMIPTHLFNVVWTVSPHEGKAVDESITFSSSEGASINADISVTFHIEPHAAPVFYKHFRETDIIGGAGVGYIRNVVREAFGDAASKRLAQDIYGAEKPVMLKEVRDKSAEICAASGITIDQITINGALRLPKLIEDGINAKLEQLQRTQAQENKVAQVRAEADQQVTAAHGAAEAARQKASGEADAMLIRARAEAQVNEIIRLSVTPTVLQYRALVDKWDGQLPKYSGSGQVPLLTIDVSKPDAVGEAERERRLKELLGETNGAATQNGSVPGANPAPSAAPAQPPPARPQPPGKNK